MAKLEEAVFDILSDVEQFFRQTLDLARLSQPEIEARDNLLHKIARFRGTFTQFILPPTPPAITTTTTCHVNTTVPSSPQPYLDMKGNNFAIDYVVSDQTEDHYEICEQESNTNNMDEAKPVEFDESYDPYKLNLISVPASEMSNSDKRGYLDKKGRGRFFNQYQRKWCAIKEGIMHYYNHITDTRQCGSITLYGYEVRSCPPGKDKKQFAFELVCPGQRTYQFFSHSNMDMLEWIAAIEKASTFNPPVAIPSIRFSDRKSRRISGVNDGIYEAMEDDRNKRGKDLYDDAKSSPVNSREWYLGMWDCDSEESNELSFRNDQLIRIISKEYDSLSWWIGEINGKVGLVPKNFLTEAYETVVEE